MGTPTDKFPRLKLSSSDSHLISIPPPRKPVNYGNCDLFKAGYCDGSLRVVLALKRPRIIGDSATQAEMVQRRFEREVAIWSQLNHINILPFYGVVELVSESFLVSEAYLASPWVEHGDLFEFLAARLKYSRTSSTLENTIPERIYEAFSTFDEYLMVLGIASGLTYLHANGVIHGDLKAANILLDDVLQPLICDFGLTKNEEFNVTSESQKRCGTGRWKCPTLEDKKPRSEKTDMFSFGMTIVEVLTGSVPFPAKTIFQVQMAFALGQRPPFEPPKSSNGKDLVPLWELAASCWTPEPDDRLNAKDVVSVLTSLIYASPPSDDVDDDHTDVDDRMDSSPLSSPITPCKRRRSTIGDSERRGAIRHSPMWR
ncbi:hypothetical protein FRB95_010808 [Tulasnella sp. JGI-2019a]|nr:hypothetical protein FRB95_010808 [Tulasnella sp. JGI-2019a]